MSSAGMQDRLEEIKRQAEIDIAKAEDSRGLSDVRVNYLGKKGQLTALLKNVSSLSVAERPAAGQAVNQLKIDLVQLINVQETMLQQRALDEKIKNETIDVTLPGRGNDRGSFHPVTQVTHRIVTLFRAMGFDVNDGPEVEDEYHNFEALNIPDHHPARAMQDTFYFGDGRLLRTHTSSVQIRVMEQEEPPFRMVTPGRVYRSDSDLTHTPMFHQLEGLVVDKHCSFAELKGLIQTFLNRFFEREVVLRFRPSYFPFTEPSAEVDIQYNKVDRETGKLTSETDWLEVLGCGMVHPNVLKNVDIDPDVYKGCAFGVGLDRMAMLYYGIADLRYLFNSDLRFLSRF